MGKTMKKLMALAVAMMMVVAMSLPAFAAPGEFTGTAETTISASNLTPGDTVEVYQLVKWNSTKSDWELNGTCGVTLAELVNGITEAEAATISASVSTTALTSLSVGSDGTVTYDCSNNPGLFYLKAIPASTNKDTVYNPAFVSADYYEGGNSVDFSSAIGSSAVVKKSGVPFDKDVVGTDKFIDTKPGDIIPYSITTKIPSYGTSFTNPVFTISDEFSTGLVLCIDSAHKFTVTYGTSSTEVDVANVVDIEATNGASSFTVAFDKAYLTGLAGDAPNVTITYFGKVTTEALNNVTYMDNKAKLTFSNKPNETVDKEDITRHYTFSIDGNILGQTGKKGSELIKTGTDAQGNIIQEYKETFHDTEVSYLNGAQFKLEGKAGTNTEGVTKTFITDGKGYITFNGLDAGEYTLTEVSAPTGFIKDSRVFTVKITPTYDETIKDLLKSYEITITSPADGDTPAYNGGATFTMTNNGGTTIESTIESASNFINNTQGSELPSTGGMGTTIFYVIGGILVLAAAIILISRRKVQQ